MNLIDDVYSVLAGSRCEIDFGANFAAEGLSPEERMVRRFEYLCSLETPRIHPEEQIVLTRSVENLPDVLTEAEKAKLYFNKGMDI